MRFNEAWLREWTNPALNTDDLSHRLTMAGLEVDALEPSAAAFSGVVIAQVRTTAPHPQADKLALCEVFDGAETHQVVCGAPNVRPGLRVPLARVGAVLPGDFKIKAAKLRGEPSNGMLCGASELGLEDILDGLLELPADAPIGTDFREWLQLDDSVFELGLTPNRADCLSVRGIAREVAVVTGSALNELSVEPAAVTSSKPLSVTLDAPEACPRYVGRVIEGVKVAAESPLWLREKLRRAGLRSIDAIVDITNLVLLELGQPLHAFDLDKLQGGIVVRYAQPAEKITLLDEHEIALKDKDLLIADQAKAVAFAGIMGGANSAVTEETQNIFLESAFFAPLAIAGHARAHGLHTDASHRFERGVDPALQEQALERATQLILSIAGGAAGPLITAESASHVPTPNTIGLTAGKIERLLGVGVPEQQVTDILTRLGFVVSGNAANGWQAKAPSWRFDMEREEDLIEELARVVGYADLPTRLPSVRAEPTVTEQKLSLRRLADALQDRGYQEVISYSFVAEEIQNLVTPGNPGLPLANPLSAELAVMRGSLWAGMLQVARYNLNRQAGRLRLFETGLRFVQTEEHGLLQEPMLAGLVTGSVEPQHWSGKGRSVDFFDLKGDVAALLALSGRAISWRAAELPALHPGQTAQVLVEGDVAGYLGKIHPGLAAELDITPELYLFELKQDVILPAKLPKFVEISDQPAVSRDLAFVLSESVQAGEVMVRVREVCGEALRDITLFDVYRGQNLGDGLVSLALGLTFQERSRTLRDSDISTLVEAVVSLLKQEFNASLRE